MSERAPHHRPSAQTRAEQKVARMWASANSEEVCRMCGVRIADFVSHYRWHARMQQRPRT